MGSRITEHTNSAGQKVYKVKVWAQVRPGTPKVQQEKRNILSHREAKAVEKLLVRDTQMEAFARDHAGSSFGSVVEDFSVALHTGQGIERPVGKTTAEDNIAALRMYCKSWWKLLARDITRAQARKVFDEMTMQGKSKSRMRAVKNAIQQCYNFGIETGRILGIQQSPVVGFKIGREEEKKPDILTLTEIKLLLRYARELGHPWFWIWAFALLTGARSGELHALLWSDIDWENRRLTISKTWNGRMKGTKETKGGYWRQVPISDELEALLKELRATASGRAQVLPRFIEWDRGESARILRKFCQGIGITSVKFHALRACFATQLLRDNIAPVIVMKICGWKDLKTMQRYVRLAGIEITGATDRLKILPPAQVMGRVVELFGAGGPA